MANENDVLFSIAFKEGLAERNRLPIEHVINTLRHINLMVREVGRLIERDAGVEEPQGDFGIELLAGSSGVAFRKGSLATAAVVTRNLPHAILAITTLIKTADALQGSGSGQPLIVSEYGEEILRRLPKVSEIQEQDETELHMALSQGSEVLIQAKLGQAGRAALKALEASEFGVEAVTLYGKLRQLRDFSRGEERIGHFWGELLEDNGRTWRVRFEDRHQPKVLGLFRKQVRVLGDATYFKTKTPRVDAKEIHEEPMPDYLAALTHFSEGYRDIFPGRKAEDILKSIRE